MYFYFIIGDFKLFFNLFFLFCIMRKEKDLV